MGEIVYIHNYGGDHKVATVFDVANYFISRASLDAESGSVMTHLKLQKLCYYAQAWSLALNDKPLFQDEFEAWDHGPVCYDLYQKYKDYGYTVINECDEDYELDVFTDKEIEILNDVWDEYGKFDAKYLERLTHSEATWINSRNGYIPSEEKCRSSIDKSTIKKYYKNLLKD